MRRYYDCFTEFSIFTAPHGEQYTMRFTYDWSYTEMFDYMCDIYAIDRDSIIEVCNNNIKRFKTSKDV